MSFQTTQTAHPTLTKQPEILDQEDSFKANKDISTLTSLAESTSEKSSIAQTFYKYHHGYFQSYTLKINLNTLIIKGPETLVFRLSDLLGATLKENFCLKNYQGNEPLYCLKVHILAKRYLKGIYKDSETVYDRDYKKIKFYIWSKEFAFKWKNLLLHAANNPDFSSLVKVHGFYDLPIYKKKLLVFVNAKSGMKKGLKRWKKAQKILKKGGCEYVEVMTQYRGHAKDCIRQYDPAKLKEFDGFLSVSGDGGLHEIINGLYNREDWKEFQEIPFGVIPSGTSNSIIKNLFVKTKEKISTKNVCNMIVKGRTIKSDLTMLETEDNTKIFYMIIFAWAAFATIDIESNKLRSLGKSRFMVYGLWNILNLKKYRAKFAYSNSETELPDINEEIKGDSWSSLPEDIFGNLSIHNIAWISKKHQVVPSADFQDGINHVLSFGGEKVSRKGLAMALGSFKGKVFKGDQPDTSLKMKYEKIKAFRIEPFGNNLGHFDIDGEGYPAMKVQGKVLEKHLTLFGPSF